ncbi:MAG: arylsulfatase [Kiritimatiellales bacterium]|nr:arylsulfatase [Kiritimatiellales bacterium]
MRKLLLLTMLLHVGFANAVLLVDEHFATASDTSNDVPGWTSIARFVTLTSPGNTSELLTGGQNYGLTVAGVDGFRRAMVDGYVHNDSSTSNNRFTRPLASPVDFAEGDTFYFSMIVKGTRRANMGLGNGMGTAFPDTLVSVGANPQLLQNADEPNMAQSFNASVWLGDTNTMQKGNSNEVLVPEDPEAVRLVVGRLVNNIGAADEISYHIINLSSNVVVPATWTGSALAGSDGFYSKTDFDFGGNQVFSNLFINLQNESGLDEIRIGTEYADAVPPVVQTRPDIIVMLVDDMGYSDFGCYGGEARTPNIDALATSGLRFRDFHNTARCSPTRAALLTGNYTHQVVTVPGDSLPPLREDNNSTIAEVLKAEGYRTYMAGKWHLGATVGKVPWVRGFRQVFGFTPSGAGAGADYWDSTDYKFTSESNEIPTRVYGTNAYEFYQTDALADYSLDFINHHQSKGDAAPFFLYLPFNAPHFSIAAPLSLAEYTPPGGQSYSDIYSQGWDVVRQNRYNRMLSLGVIDGTFSLAPTSDTPYNGGGAYWAVPAWNTLAADRKADLTRRMALYTAMIDKIDGTVGRIVEHLQLTGRFDNTLIFLLSDNGGNAEGGLYGSAFGTANHAPLTGTDLDNMGQPFVGDGIHIGGGWANVANTPFRYYKRYSHEGGIRTPLIVHWPEGIANPGRWSNQTGHLIDIMRTVVDVTGATFPTQYNGHVVLPMEGESLVPIFNDGPEFDRQIGFEHESTRAWRDGRWKLVTKTFTTTDWSSFADTLELYDMLTDPTELNNVAMDHPDRLVAMVNAWNAWAQRVGVPSERLLSLPKLSGPGMQSTDLLLDTFNRNDLSDIDATTNGVSGAIAWLPNAVHYEGYEGPKTPDNIQVFGGALRMAVGAGMSESGIMNNFTNQSILDAGGFVVEMDVTAINSGTSQPMDRYAGFGVGMTATEAAAGSDISGTKSFRGSTNNPIGKADFFVDLDVDGNVKVWSNGTLLDTVSAGATNGRLTAAFALGSFSAGAPVEASVYFNGVRLDINTANPNSMTRIFNWQNTAKNYIGLSARATDHAEIDNLSIRTFPLGSSLASGYALAAGLSGSDAANDSDPDGDGRSNYLEWLIGSDPTVADADIRPLTLLSVPVSAGQVRFGMRRLVDAASAGVGYNVYSSTNLVDWVLEAATEVSAVPIPENPDYEEANLEITVTDPEQDRLFIMIRYE